MRFVLFVAAFTDRLNSQTQHSFHSVLFIRGLRLRWGGDRGLPVVSHVACLRFTLFGRLRMLLCRHYGSLPHRSLGLVSSLPVCSLCHRQSSVRRLGSPKSHWAPGGTSFAPKRDVRACKPQVRDLQLDGCLAGRIVLDGWLVSRCLVVIGAWL